MHDTPDTQNSPARTELHESPGSAPLCYESDDLNVICPHCGASYQAEAEDFSERVRVEECFKCKKKYQLWDEMNVTHHTSAFREPNTQALPRGGAPKSP